MKGALPTIAIIGRPNVGKSSLFNLLIKERKSIVDEMEGVTRDINIGEFKTLRGRAFRIYDTAGYLEKGDQFNKLVQEKVKQAIAYADLILFLVDGREYHPIDEELGRFLRKQDKPVLVIANKLDHRKFDDDLYEFYNLGFEQIVPFSVVHKRGVNDLYDTFEDMFPEGAMGDDESGEICVSIVGRPNVGKSMLVNTLLGYERSIVSEVPGTTRDSLDDVLIWKGRKIRLIDTAGLRRTSRVEDDIEYYSAVRTAQAIERSHVVIQLLEANEPVSHQDKHISEMVIEKGRGLIFAYNKWDLMGLAEDGEENYRRMQEFRKMTLNEYPTFDYIPLEFISAKDNYKIGRLMELVFEVYGEYNRRVPTPELNEWLKQEIRETDLDKPKSNLKVYYATQPLTAPPKFIIFVNKRDHIRKDFPRFLEKRIRARFGFSGVPVRMFFKQRERDKKNT